MPTPPDNPLAAEKAAPGRKLRFDKRLSRDDTVSSGARSVLNWPSMAMLNGKED